MTRKNKLPNTQTEPQVVKKGSLSLIEPYLIEFDYTKGWPAQWQFLGNQKNAPKTLSLQHSHFHMIMKNNHTVLRLRLDTLVDKSKVMQT